jgi:hypothetical protein
VSLVDFSLPADSWITDFQPSTRKEFSFMDTSKLVPSAIALGICYGVAHFVKNPMVKAAAFGAMGVIVAKQVPYVREALA